jgi:hypothetical protein
MAALNMIMRCNSATSATANTTQRRTHKGGLVLG